MGMTSAQSAGGSRLLLLSFLFLYYCIRRAVFHALSSIDENEDESYQKQQERQSKILAIYSCGVSILTEVIWKITETKKLA